MVFYKYTGADPGIFVRGVQLSENFDKQKKKEKGGGQVRGGGGNERLWLFSFLQKNGLNQFSRQLFAYVFFCFFFGGGG